MISSKEELTSNRETVNLKPVLGPVACASYVVGNIIGSGIFITPTGILKNALSVGLTLTIWTACGLIALLGAFTLIELGCNINKPGGRYIYIKECFGPFLGFIFLWTELVMIQPSSMSTMAMTMAAYVVRPAVGLECEPPGAASSLLASGTLVLLACVNVVGVKWGAKLQIVTTVGKVLGLFIIIVAGFYQLYVDDFHNVSFENAFANSQTEVGPIVLAFYSGMWAYAGWDSLNWGITEVKDPRRTLPIAILFGTAGVMLVYTLTNIAYFSVLTPTEIVEVDAVAVSFGTKMLGAFWWLMPVAVVISVFGGLNANMFGVSRLFFAGSAEGQMMPVLAMVDIHQLTPVPAVISSTVISVAIVWAFDIFALINWFSFVYWTEMAIIALGLLYQRFKAYRLARRAGTDPEKKMVQYPVLLHMILLLVSSALAGIPWVTQPIECLKGVAFMLASVPLYLFFLSPRTASFREKLHPLHAWLTETTQKYIHAVFPEKME